MVSVKNRAINSDGSVSFGTRHPSLPHHREPLAKNWFINSAFHCLIHSCQHVPGAAGAFYFISLFSIHVSPRSSLGHSCFFQSETEKEENDQRGYTQRCL